MTTKLGRRALAGAAALLPTAGIASARPARNPPTRARSIASAAPRPAHRRVAGELPYFQKDLASGEWSGACIEMAKDIAKVFDAKLAMSSRPMATRCSTCSPTRSISRSR